MHISNGTKTVLLSLTLIIGGGLIALAAWGSQAQAADKGGPSKVFEDLPAPAKSPSWTGFYIGALGAYDRHDTEMASINFSARDFSYGATIGGDYRFKGTRIVGGIMIDYLRTNADSAISAFDGSLSVAARLGFLASDTMLIYGLGGYTKSDLANSLTKPLDLDAGFTVGAGIEAYLLKNVTAKFEYRWVDEGTAAGGLLDQTSQSVRAGLNYRF